MPTTFTKGDLFDKTSSRAPSASMTPPPPTAALLMPSPPSATPVFVDPASPAELAHVALACTPRCFVTAGSTECEPAFVRAVHPQIDDAKANSAGRVSVQIFV